MNDNYWFLIIIVTQWSIILVGQILLRRLEKKYKDK